MTDPVTLDLAAIRARAEAATPGPYRAKAFVGPEGFIDSWEILTPCPIEGHPKAVRTIAQELDEAEASHFATMDPPTTLALLNEIERLKEENDQFLEQLAERQNSALRRELQRVMTMHNETIEEAAQLRIRTTELEAEIKLWAAAAAPEPSHAFEIEDDGA